MVDSVAVQATLVDPFPQRQRGPLPLPMKVAAGFVEQVGDVVGRLLAGVVGGVVDNGQDVREQQPPGRPGCHFPRLVGHRRSQHTDHIGKASSCSSMSDVAVTQQRRRHPV